jgi:hypothetical protein
MSDLAPILLALCRKYYWRYVALCADRPIIRFSWIFHIRCASFISGVRIVAPIVLAQHKEHERIGEARTSMQRASPIVIEQPETEICSMRDDGEVKN